MRSRLVVGLCWLQCISLCLASAANWTKPNSQNPSFTDTYTVGETIRLSWLNLNDSTNDLWLTRYDTQTDDFALRIGVDLDIANPGYVDWIIAVSDSEVHEDTRFVLKFVPEGAIYNSTSTASIASPAFNLILVNQQTLPNGTVLPSSSTASATSTNFASSTASSTSSPANQPTPSQPAPVVSHGLSNGARVAITVVGVFAAITAIAGILYAYVAWKRRQRKAERDSLADEKLTGPYEVAGDKKHPFELSHRDTNISELTSSRETMVSEAGSSMIHEMGNINKRPGLHEMPG